MVIDAYNSAQNVRVRSDYLIGAVRDPATAESGFQVEPLLERMDAAGVDKAMVGSLAQRPENDFLADLVAKHPDRLFGFGQVMPQWDDAVDQIRTFAAKPGMLGLKLHPTLHGYLASDRSLLDPIFEVCREEGLAVLFNALDDAFCSPLGVEEVARNFPEVPTVLAHMGIVWNVPDAIRVAERNDNIYLETSTTLLCDVRHAYRRLGPEKILMGSDWPASDFDLERMKIAKVITNDDDRALVEGENLARILSI